MIFHNLSRVGKLNDPSQMYLETVGPPNFTARGRWRFDEKYLTYDGAVSQWVVNDLIGTNHLKVTSTKPPSGGEFEGFSTLNVTSATMKTAEYVWTGHYRVAFVVTGTPSSDIVILKINEDYDLRVTSLGKAAVRWGINTFPGTASIPLNTILVAQITTPVSSSYKSTYKVFQNGGVEYTYKEGNISYSAGTYAFVMPDLNPVDGPVKIVEVEYANIY